MQFSVTSSQLLDVVMILRNRCSPPLHVDSVRKVELRTGNWQLRTGLRSFVGRAARQVFQFFLVDLELVALFHVLAQIRKEQAEQFFLLGLQE
jgi:hypothetical protein